MTFELKATLQKILKLGLCDWEKLFIGE